MFRNIVIFYGEELLVPRPTPKLEGHPMSAVRDCLVNVFAATLHIRWLFLHPQPEDAPCRDDRDPLIIHPCKGGDLLPATIRVSSLQILLWPDEGSFMNRN
jgi:hypothetical protein